MPDTSHHLQQLTSQLYEGVLSTESWAAALHSISALTHCPSVSILEFDPRSRQSSLVETVGVSSDTQAAYNAHFHQIDEAIPFGSAMPEGAWYHDRRDLGEQHIQRSEFYQDFFLRHGLATTTCNRLIAGDGTNAYLSLQRHSGQALFADADFALFGQFLPHVQRAMRIRMQLRHMNERAGLASLVLNQLHVALLVLDERGRLLLANTQGDNLLRRMPQLQAPGGQLHVQGLRAGELDRLLAKACGRRAAAQAGAALLRNAQGQPTLQMLVLPLPANLHSINTWQRPLALAVLSEPDQPRSVQPQLLHQLYGLTAAEARVAQAIYQGDTPAQAAEHLGVTVGTLRSQLKAIFAKTGASRQAELIRLLSVLRMVG
jgi:DNA-binding CsgD family transcriptional regulator